MTTLNWLDENEHRAYPLTTDAPDAAWVGGLVDAAFYLGSDIPLDLDQDLEQLSLTEIVVHGAGSAREFASTWTFTHTSGGAAVVDSAVITVSVPANPARHSTWKGSSPGGKSTGKITLGDPSLITSTGAISVPLEDRVLRVLGDAATQQIRVYNTVRPSSYRPYFTADVTKSPAQNYLDAVANSPYGGVSTARLVTTAGTTLSGGVSLAAGYNADVSADGAGNRVSFGLRVGGGDGRYCDEPAAGVGYSGTLRAINGQPAVRGDLWLSVGPDFEVLLDQDNHKVTIRLKPLSDALGCGRSTEQQEPAAIPGPP